MMVMVHGACHCGAIAYEAGIDPARVTVCHCMDCQTISGSAFRLSVPVPGSAFKMTGQPATYIKTAESGNRREQGFCPKCGSPIYSTTPGPGPKESYMLRVGILRQRDRLNPKLQIWTRSARPWLARLSDIPKNETQQGTSHLR